MPSYTLEVLGLEVSFKAKADHTQVLKAKELLEERYRELAQHGRRLSKEKLLTFLALGLADDLLQNREKLEELDGKLTSLLSKIDKGGT
ncbi:cell division protein ZapA [Desulfobaculum bizertense]|uniref:Cell division protein ZapA n=1 Tax=Desulfobaculum bizertense DSM 18034 TaxID=1121442 RepID=A0A1T4WRT5_9BACT|nr:cell division protein ZapA [Desulfobaculum bizertense]UIJ37265.1 cell division protein ZapA [Desulfobaculum bizertense]SKA80064.1 cell division protein ZapA [Desulfobaculum bizertense DSM 18034]